MAQVEQIANRFGSELERLIFYIKGNRKNVLDTSLFNLLATYVASDLIENSNRMKSNDLYQTAGVKFLVFHETAHVKSQIQEILDLLPNKTWPPSFDDFILKKQEIKPPKQRKNSKKPPPPPLIGEELQQAQVTQLGEKVWKAFLSVKKSILTEYNPSWDGVEMHRSGNSLFAYYDSLREKVWVKRIPQKAKEGLRQARDYKD